MHRTPLDNNPRIRAEAWVGDAILALYVREWILSFRGEIDGKLFIEFTSNNFLRLVGNATGVEAQIGRAFKSDGLEAAYAWIGRYLLPKMEDRLHILRSKGETV